MKRTTTRRGKRAPALKLRPVNRGRNRFCGPAVLSSLTGMDTDEASRAIRQVTGKASTMGTSYGAMIGTLRRHGIVASTVESWGNKKVRERPTIAQWLRSSKYMRTSGRVFLLSAGRHWQLISGRRFVCGLTGEIVSIRDKRAGRRRRVKTVWLLEQVRQ